MNTKSNGIGHLRIVRKTGTSFSILLNGKQSAAEEIITVSFNGCLDNGDAMLSITADRRFAIERDNMIKQKRGNNDGG